MPYNKSALTTNGLLGLQFPCRNRR